MQCFFIKMKTQKKKKKFSKKKNLDTELTRQNSGPGDGKSVRMHSKVLQKLHIFL